MEIYLIRHAQAEEQSRVVDPYSLPLTAAGRERSLALAALCRDWGVQFLCASTLLRAQQTAEIIAAQLPTAERWDLAELEEMSIDDLVGEMITSHLIAQWPPAQVKLGYERLWGRVTAALARIEIYAHAHEFERVAIVTHRNVINLFLMNWLGLDWRALDCLTFAIAPGATCKVVVEATKTCIEWVNCQ
jgi:broad specificity phosphatase PhoE